MSKQIQVGMKFTADTSQAQNAINSLKQNLQQLAYGSKPIGVDSASFEQASRAAKELSYHLNQAYNSQTGKLDLSKLDASLKSSKTSLSQLTQSFAGAGDAGKQAFVGLAQSIANAEQPAIRLNGFLGDMWTTLKNTARWQISANLLQGLTGGVQKAYRYAQDLNESLNNIRIVTGYNADKMADFAVEANKAAKALSTTTTAYTDAALIYYQQGLSGSDVTDRVETTVKLANVSRQSAEEVSDQLTAIWNNFYDGSRSLESYADTLTALGAATASSTEEISAGLEKFAAIADTVGLSYDYAAAALATVTATTRQSADVVGTAFRTLFGRLQDLELGETLEDGTDLGKYSKALATVGVQIKDVSGEMKDMDQILDDLGSRWDKLDKATQTALAQTVGGTRQYAQLIALMDNWSFFQQNLGVAQRSEGTLQEQADIYAESWEAAEKRVKTSAESIYQAIIDDKFFIGFNNTLADLLSGVGKFFKEIGGGKTLVIGLLTLAADIMSTKIQPMVENLVRNIKVLAGGSAKYYQDMAKSNSEMIETRINDPKWNFNDDQKNDLRNAERLATMRARLAATENLSESEKRQAEIEVQMLEMSIAKSKEELAIWEQKKQLVEQIGDAVTSAEEKLDNSLEKQIQLNRDAIDSIQDRIDALRREQEAVQSRFNNAEQGYNQAMTEQATGNARILATRDTISIQNIFPENELQGLQEQVETVAFNIQRSLKEAFVSNNINGFANEIIEQFRDFDNINLDNINIDNFVQAREQIRLFASALGDLGRYPEDLRVAFQNVFNTREPNEFTAALTILRQRLGELQDTDFSKAFNQLESFGIPDNVIQSLREYRNSVQETTEIQRRLDEAIGESNNTSQYLSDIYEELREKAKELSTEELQDYKTKLQEANASNTVIKAIDELIKKKQNLSKATKEADEAGQSFKNTSEQINNIVNNFNPVHTITGIEALTKTAAAAGGVAMAFNSLKGAIQALNNEDASGLEKISSILMALSFGVPSVIRVFTNFKDVLLGLAGKGFNLLTKEALASELATKKDTIAKLDDLVVTKKAAKAKFEEAEAEAFRVNWLNDAVGETYANIIATELKNDKTLEEAVNTAKAAIAEEAKATAINKTTKSTWKQIGALIVANGWILAIVGAIGALIAVLAIAYKNSPEQKMKALNEEFKEIKGRIDETTQAVKDLKSDFDSYDDIVDKLKKCTKGTDEWKEALQEVEAQTLELLNKYPNLNEALEYDSKAGTYVFSDKGREELTDKVNAEAKAAKYDAYNNRISYQEEYKKSTEQDMDSLLARDFNYTDKNGNVGIVKLTQEDIDSIVNEEGQLNRDKALERILSEKAGGAEITDNLDSVKDMLNDRADALQENTEALNRANLLAAEAVSKNEAVQNSDMRDYIIQSASKARADKISEYKEQGITDWTSAAEEYEKITGREVKKRLFADGYKYKDENGDWVNISKEDMQGTIFQDHADKYIEEEYGKGAAQMFDNLKKVNEDAIDVYKALADGDSEALAGLQQSGIKIDEAIEAINEVTKDSALALGDSVDGIQAEAQKLINRSSIDKLTNSLKESFNEIDSLTTKSLLKDKKPGDIFKQDDYDKIIASAGESARKYFKDMGDGTYQLTVAAENFLDTINQGTAKQITDQWQNYNKTNEAFQSYSGMKQFLNEDGTLNKDQVYDAEGNLKSGVAANAFMALKQTGIIDESTKFDAEAVKEYIDTFANVDVSSFANGLLSCASSVDELNQRMLEASNLGGDAMAYYDLYSTALMKMAAQYENTSNEIEKYNNALLYGTDQQIQSAEADLRAATELGEAAEKYNLDAKNLEHYANSLAEQYDLSADEARQLAVANERLDRGAGNLNKNLESYTKILKKANKGTAEYSDTINAIKEDLADMFNVADADMFSDTFTEAMMQSEDFKKALDGDVEALERLRIQAADDIVTHLDIDDSQMLQVGNTWDTIKYWIENTDILAPGMDQRALFDSFNSLITQAGLTKDQIESIFGALHIGADVTTTMVEQKVRTPVTTQEHNVIIKNGGDLKRGIPASWYSTDTTSTHYIEETQEIPGYEIKGNEDGSFKNIFKKLPAPSMSKGSTTSGQKSGSGGGGGGSSQKKSLDEEKERYHSVDRSIKAVTDELDKVKDATDRAYGTDKLQGMIQQQQLLTEQLELESQKLEEIGKYLDEDKKKLDQYGASYDQDGNIANYDELFTRQFAKYESGAWSDDDWEAFKKAIDQYEETLDLMQEETEKKADLTREYLDSKLEAIEYKVEVQIEVDERDIKLIDYYLSKIEDKAFNAAESIALINKKIDEFTSENDTNLQGFKETLEQAGASVQDIEDILNGKIDANALAEKLNLTEQQKEDLDGYADSLLEINEALFEANQAVKDKLTEAFEEFEEELDDVIAKFDHFDSMLSSMRDIGEILNLSDSTMALIDQTQVDNAINKVAATKSKLDDIERARADTMQKLEQARAEGNQAAIDGFEESLKQIEESYAQTEEDLMSSWYDALQANLDAFQANVEKSLKVFGQVANAFKDLETLQDAREKNKNEEDRLLPDYEKAYRLSKLQRDLEKQMDELNDPAAKAKLLEIQEKITEAQAEGVQMSEYQMKYLEKQYDLKLAQIALENEQNAKTKVRLRRDSEGNLGYVYTADEEKVDEAAQKYEDILFELQEMTDNYLDEMQDRVISDRIAMAQEIAALDRSLFESEEEYEAAIKRISDYYMADIEFALNEIDNAIGNNQELYEGDAGNYEDATGRKINANKDLVLDFKDTFLSENSGSVGETIETTSDYYDNLATSWDKTVDDIKKYNDQYVLNNKEACDAAGQDIGQLSQTFGEKAEEIKTESDKVADSIQSIGEEAAAAFGGALNSANDFWKKYQPLANSIISQNEAIAESWNKITQAIIDQQLEEAKRREQQTSQQTPDTSQGSGSGSSGGSSGGSGGGGSGGSGKQEEPDVALSSTWKSSCSPTNDEYHTLNSWREVTWSKSGVKKDSQSSVKEKHSYTASFISGYIVLYCSKCRHSKTGSKHYSDVGSTTAQAALSAALAYYNSTGKMGSFATGGYTGDWGDSSGKLAVLHQKELVLNKEDTKNFLDSVNILRNITSTIDLHALSSSMGLRDISAAVIGQHSQDLVQHVEINASFPAVQDHNEIELALSNLINDAAQYVGRKN